MKIVLDESVSYGLAEVLRHEGQEISLESCSHRIQRQIGDFIQG